METINSTPNPQKKSSKGIWIGVGVALFLCVVACGLAFFIFRNLGQRMTQQIENSNNPDQIEAVASKIATYQVPPGYSEQMALDLGLYRTVALVPDDSSKPMIMLMGYSQSMGADSQQMQEQLQKSFEQQVGMPGMTWTTVDEYKTTIRGQEVNVLVREGQAESVAFRQLVVVFEGENGTVMVMAQGDAASWDQEVIDEFLSSIQ